MCLSQGVKKISSSITAITAMRRGFGILPASVGGGLVKVVAGRVTTSGDQKSEVLLVTPRSSHHDCSREEEEQLSNHR